MSLSLAKTLSSKLRENELGHFYLLRGDNFQNTLETDSKELVSEIIANIQNISVEKASQQIEMGHPDILLINLDENKKSYVLDDFKEFFSFQKYRPLQLPHRFILVNQADAVGRNELANKLLKTLEEPSAHCTIFFCCDYNANLLATIESRGITLKLSPKQKSFTLDGRNKFWPEFESYLKEREMNHLWSSQSQIPAAHEAFENLKSSHQLQKAFLKCSLEWLTSQPNNMQHKEEALKALKWFQSSEAYHNPMADRLLPLIHLVSK